MGMTNEEVRAAMVRLWTEQRDRATEALTLLATNPDQSLPPGLPPTAEVPPVPTNRVPLAKPERFFALLKQSPGWGPSLSQAEVDGCNRIMAACAEAGLGVGHTAYVLATDFHETAGTMTPIREYGRGKGRPYGVPGRHGGQIPYGRGDVQLTWASNYERADKELGLGGRLLADYDLALDPQISARIIVRGMAQGWFTGKKLADYIPPGQAGNYDQFIAARAIVNGSDKAALIAGYAVGAQAGLVEGGWHVK